MDELTKQRLIADNARAKVKKYKKALREINHLTFEDFNICIDIQTGRVSFYGDTKETLAKYYKVVEGIKKVVSKALEK